MDAMFDEAWSKIASMFPADLFSTALSVQDDNILERISGHLTRTQQWPTFQTSVEQAARVFDAMKWWSNYSDHSTMVEFFKRIAADYAQAPGSVVSSGSGKSVFADRSQCLGHGNPAAAAGL